MDPIVTPALLAALYAAVTKKAVGVAAERIVEAAQVQAGKLGKKTGEGFYKWSPDGKRLG